MLDQQTKKLDLPDVTLVCAYNNAHKLNAMAVEECTKKINFGCVIQYSVGGGDTTLNWWENVVWYRIPNMVPTSHFLLIQYDSWVLDTTIWNPKWLEYDYIGAPWWRLQEKYNMGNGGFSLRSTKLMRHVGMNCNLTSPEDNAICIINRPRLEDTFKFASVDDALLFSRERIEATDQTGKQLSTFGYHGVFRWPEFLTREQIDERLRLAPEYVLKHANTQELLRQLGQTNEMHCDDDDFFTDGSDTQIRWP